MIKIENLSISFDEQQVINQLSAEFATAQIHGIVGLNGAGKTTFFNMLSTLLEADEGQILFNNQQITKHDAVYLETHNYFYSRITGNEYLRIFEQSNADFNLAVLQGFFQLPLDDLIETYSTGMKKKLALLSVLKQNKPIVLMDEPFNGLDLESNKVVELVVSALKEKGKTVFLSSHIIDPLLAVCDVIHLLANGQFVKTFEKAEFADIDQHLFGKFKEEARIMLAKAI